VPRREVIARVGERLGRVAVGVGLHSNDGRAVDLRQCGRLHLGGGVAGQQSLVAPPAAPGFWGSGADEVAAAGSAAPLFDADAAAEREPLAALATP